MIIKLSCSKYGSTVQQYLSSIASVAELYGCRAYRDQMNRRLAVNSIIKTDKVNNVNSFSSYDSDKIKVRFYHCNASTFNVIQTICDSFIKDDRFDVLIVLFGNAYSDMITQMKEGSYPFVEDYNYNLKEDNPDISIIYHVEIFYPPQLQNIRAFSNYVVLVPLSIGSIWFGNSTVKRMNLDWFKANLCFVGNLCYNRLIEPIGEDVIEKMSPPQFDISYRRVKQPPYYPKGWEKLKGKKVVMLMTDHGLRLNGVSSEVSFDLYFHSLIDYYEKNQDCGFIIRPHFALIKELVGTFWSIGDYKKIVDLCLNSSNIVWDESDDYLTGLLISDACLVDVNCSLIYYVLAADIPIGIPLRYDKTVDVNNPELLSHYYQINSEEKLIEFLDMVKNDEDDLIELRREAFSKYVETFDGNNGKRIYEKIVERYYKFLESYEDN